MKDQGSPDKTEEVQGRSGKTREDQGRPGPITCWRCTRGCVLEEEKREEDDIDDKQRGLRDTGTQAPR